MTAVKELAYAKTNLFLDIDSKMPDGFHSIYTVMHTVSLCDEVTVELHGIGKRIARMMIANNRFLPTDSKNLCVKAAELFMERAGIDAEIVLRLKKRLPIGGGLGGGSADAAAVLRAMNRIFKRRFSEKMLLEMAGALGSDVPFCLLGGTALCEGRGELMTRLDSSLALHLVIANSGEHVSTPMAYKELDRHYFDFDGSVKSRGIELREPFMQGISRGNISSEHLFNIFEEPILALCPRAQAIKDRLLKLGAVGVMRSGSGSSIFGIFDSEGAARGAKEALRAMGATAYYARSTKNR